MVCFNEDIPTRMTPNGLDSIGYTKQGARGPQSPILKIAEVTYIDANTCKSRLLSHNANIAQNFNGSLQICVAQGNGGRDGACHGDSGGPLFIIQNGRAHQLGVVSHGIRYCPKGTPIVYTRVSAFTDWISQNIGSSG
ncbi:venom protease-like protein [Leptotrombidium deliense]|uniref:Venom protease-like protein n=1 Tax=Leptotrombidium deliense TaxID=299467 RepID=A0A443RSJ0_9ACAR|nr:venom protease-like protein [Leptotrombidium deliense]